MHARVDAPAVLEGRISHRVLAENVESQRRAGLEIRTGGEDLDLRRHDFARPDRLPMPMSMPGTRRSAPLMIEFAMGHAEPPFGDAISVESVVPVEEDFAALGIELPYQDEDVHVGSRGRGHPHLQIYATRDFRVLLESICKARPVARSGLRIVADDAFIERRFGPQRRGRAIQVQRNIGYMFEWPVRLRANVPVIEGSANR